MVTSSGDPLVVIGRGLHIPMAATSAVTLGVFGTGVSTGIGIRGLLAVDGVH